MRVLCVLRRTPYKLSSEVGDADTPSGGVWLIALRSDSSRSDAADERCIAKDYKRASTPAKAYRMHRSVSIAKGT